MFEKLANAREQNSDSVRVSLTRVFSEANSTNEIDSVAVEEPLEIRVGFHKPHEFEHRALSITMRTPGHDFELAVGFLFTEGIIQSESEIDKILYCVPDGAPQNTVRLDLVPGVQIDFAKLDRHFYTTSSCGVCGKRSIDALSTGAQRIDITGLTSIPSSVIQSLPEKLTQMQNVFDETGGLHAAGLFNADGTPLMIREDVGRHNALDKLIGAQVLQGEHILHDKILFLSGRTSFELLQKAVMAQIPVVAAVSAPSSLAIEAAKEFGVTLIGFVREDKFNIYCNSERISYEN
ncbi:MAG: formate dehydrogenase accessory sulfurtransferase FdhD [Pyrinomonadaceae bacterium]